MKRRQMIICVACVAALAVAGPASAQAIGEWGDAPEGVNAYPNLGFVLGQFPTCMNVGPLLWVYHGPLGWAHFPSPQPPSFDFEAEGNAGLCPFPAGSYDLDE